MGVKWWSPTAIEKNLNIKATFLFWVVLLNKQIPIFFLLINILVMSGCLGGDYVLQKKSPPATMPVTTTSAESPLINNLQVQINEIKVVSSGVRINETKEVTTIFTIQNRNYLSMSNLVIKVESTPIKPTRESEICMFNIVLLKNGQEITELCETRFSEFFGFLDVRVDIFAFHNGTEKLLATEIWRE